WYRVKESGKALNRSCKNLIYTCKTPPNLDRGIMQLVGVRVTIREGDELLLIMGTSSSVRQSDEGSMCFVSCTNLNKRRKVSRQLAPVCGVGRFCWAGGLGK